MDEAKQVEPGTIRKTRGKLQIAKPDDMQWTSDKEATFLTTLAATCNVQRASRAAKMSASGAYYKRAREPEFRKAWAEALSEGYQHLELAVLDRAMNGVVRPVFYGGAMVGEINEYPDRLAMSLLSHHRAGAMAGATRHAEEVSYEEARATLETRMKAVRRKNALAKQAARDGV